MFLLDHINIAFLRFFLILTFFYGIRKLLVKKPFLFSNFIVFVVGKYAGITLVIIYILTQLKSYNLFNLTILLIIFFLVDYFNFSSIKEITKTVRKNRDTTILKLVSFAQSETKKADILNFLKSRKLSFKEIRDYCIVTFLFGLVFLSRTLYYSKDIFLFSETWFDELSWVQQISNQNWFTQFYTEMGEYALINVTSQFLKLSPSLTLQFFGVIQTALIAVLLYWVVRNVFKKKSVFFSLVAALIFILTNTISSVNTTYVLKHQLVYMVLFFMLPCLIFIIKQQRFSLKNKKRLAYFSIATLASLLVSFSVTLLVFIPFLLIILFGSYISKKSKITIASSFLVLSLLLIASFYVFYPFEKFDFFYFLKSSFINVSELGDTSNLITSYSTLIKIVFFMSAATLIATAYFSEKRYNVLQTTTLVFQLLAVLFFLPIKGIDRDILLLIFNVLTPLVFTLNAFQIMRLLNIKKTKKLFYINAACSILLVAFLAYQHNTYLKKTPNSNQTNRELLKAYNNITETHLPYSFAVVNTDKVQLLSDNNHYFISYNKFNNEYLKKDSIYHKNKKDKDFLKEYPEVVLASKIFVFEVSEIDKSITRTGFTTSPKNKVKSEELLAILKERGRDVKVFSESPRLTIYEITNQPNKSKISEMFF